MLPEKIYSDLKDVAHDTATEFQKKYGEPMYCGFADVLIKPARGNFIKFLKENDLGYSHYKGGYKISWHKIIEGHKASGSQSMDLKEHVMQAVADRLKVYLKDHTIYMTSMAD
tara:strand:- start:74 stop:412 length:339 start_codon:yes stop_codon:yes gene_type:complete